MKKVLVYIAAALLLCSCGEWLEATSSTQYKTDEIFSSREGFQDALSGVYITMGDYSAYGADATWRISDLLVYDYNSFDSRDLSAVQQHNYSSLYAKDIMEPMWGKFYNVIANINIILENIDVHASVFNSASELNWIKGELLALRAYVHFDLLRYYGLPWDEANLEKVTIPYVTSYSMEVTPQRTYRETVQMLLDDLTTAIELLADDPVTGVVSDTFDNGVNAAGYWNNRAKHMNLYACKALLARVYLWQKDYTAAVATAKEVINSAFSCDLVSWVNPEEQVASDMLDSRKDWTFHTEHLFSLEITGLYNNTMGSLIPGANNSKGFYLNPSFVESMFPTWDQAGLEDIRGTAYMLRYAGNAYVSYKLYGDSGAKYRNLMPMIRISEMYYIIAEAAAIEGDEPAVREALDVVRHYRGITDPLAEGSGIMTMVFLENAKEFLNEGQLFHFFKRQDEAFLKEVTLEGYLEVLNDYLLLPYPDAEINYGRVQEK